MRKILLLILFISTSDVSGQWTYVSNIPGFANINNISVVDQNLIWVCGDNRAVFRSTNGGINWVSRNNGLPAGSINSISALDTSSCWIGTVTGSIYRTTNGGSNWSLQFSIAGSFSNGIKMFTTSYGVYYGDPTAAGQPHQWRYTTNGGMEWILSPNAPIAPANEFGLLNAWDWIDTGKFWLATGNFTPNAASAKIFKTVNGFAGGAWTSSTLSGTGNTNGLYYSSIAFTDINNGMAACNGTGNAIRKTTDGGNSWLTVANPPGISNFIPFNMNGLKDGSNLVFALLYTSANNCFRTSDYGTTWIQETLPPQAQTGSLRQMQFINSSIGFAVGFNGVFLRYGSSIGITLTNSEVPSDYVLSQNYPNPFNPATTIRFSIPNSAKVSLKIHDALGKEIAVILDEYRSAGNYSAVFTFPSNLNSGIYFYTLTSKDFSKTKKLILLK